MLAANDHQTSQEEAGQGRARRHVTGRFVCGFFVLRSCAPSELRVLSVTHVVRVRVRRVMGLRAWRAGFALREGRVACVVAPVPLGYFF